MAGKSSAAENHGKASEYIRVLRDHLPELKERYGVASLGIFGSYVSGEERADSDLDAPLTWFEFSALRIHLSELVGIDVDLVMERALKRRIGERILNQVIRV